MGFDVCPRFLTFRFESRVTGILIFVTRLDKNIFYFTLAYCLLRPLICLRAQFSDLLPISTEILSPNSKQSFLLRQTNNIQHGKLSVDQRAVAKDEWHVSRWQTSCRRSSLYTSTPQVRPSQQDRRDKHHGTSQGRSQDTHINTCCH